MATHRYRAPAANGAVLAEPSSDEIPALVEANSELLDRADVTIGGLPLRELRALARREVLALASAEASRVSNDVGRSSHPCHHWHGSPDGPLLLAGHQPELAHPGVWVKNFAINGLARKLGGIPLHLVVDNDTLKSTLLRFPILHDHDSNSVRLEGLAFDTNPGGWHLAYEGRQVFDPQLFASTPDRAASLCANWGYEPLLAKCWTNARNIGDAFTAMRRERERAWGCDNLELPVSKLSKTAAFARFVWHLWCDLPRFHAVYNAAVARYRQANGIRGSNHPVPDLAQREGRNEAPFWSYLGSARKRRGKPMVHALSACPEFIWSLEGEPYAKPPLPHNLDGFIQHVTAYREIRPRALTLTLFARVCLGDLFIHGIGGGKYDEVTDAIIRDYFGIEPPAYQVLSATLHLPLPGFPSTPDDLKRAGRRVRDLHWNPHRFLSAEQLANPEVKTMLAAREALVSNEPPYAAHAARRERFRAFQRITERLRSLVAAQMPEAEVELRRARSEVEANAILQRRDYAWVLYPEETLRPFMQRFLEIV